MTPRSILRFLLGLSRSALLLVATGAVVLSSGCSRGERPIADARDLTEALGRAGAAVSETAALAGLQFATPGRVLQVNQALVQVIEFDTFEARQEVSDQISPDGLTFAGQPLIWTERPNLWAVGRLIVVYEGTDGGTILLLSGLLGDPLTGAAAADGEPYPPAVTAAIGTLAHTLGLDPAGVEVVTFEEVEWPDACLGMPSTAEDCVQEITPGWRVVLRAGGSDYELHTDALGDRVRRR